MLTYFILRRTIKQMFHIDFVGNQTRKFQSITGDITVEIMSSRASDDIVKKMSSFC